MPSIAKTAVVLSIFALLVGLLIPTLINSTSEQAQQTTLIENQSTKEITDVLDLSVEQVNASNDSARLRVEDTRDIATNQTRLNVSENKTLSLSGENITLKLRSFRSDSKVAVTSSYPATFGFNDGTKIFVENSGIIIGVLASLMIFALIGRTVNV